MGEALGRSEPTHIGQLKPDSANPRSHNPRNIGMIADSLQKVGAARSIVIDENDVILAGNGVIEAAAQAGIENVRVIEATGNEIIAVRRSGLTPEQRTLLKYYDNRTTDTSTFDASQIAADLEAGLDLSGLFYPEELSAILEQAADQLMPGEPPEAQVDRAAELQEQWATATGQLWELGEHRLICGDCTDRAVVERVMQGEKPGFCFTDPPYNVGVAYGDATDDNQSFEDYAEWCHQWLIYLPERFCMTPGVKHLLWWDTIIGDPQWVIAWVKRNGQGNTGIGGTNKWDPILVYGCERDNDIDLIELNNDYSEHIQATGSHPTGKPVDLWRMVIQRFAKSADLVYEPFGGSGTTLLACQQSRHKCRAIEIEPKFVGVALERWHEMTGLEPRLL